MFMVLVVGDVLFISLFILNCNQFAKPSWKLVEVEDEEADDKLITPDHKLDDEDEKDPDQNGNDYRPPGVWFE